MLLSLPCFLQLGVKVKIMKTTSKRINLIVIASIIGFFIISCTAAPTRWSSERSNLHKGQHADSVLQLLGDPYRRHTDSDKNEVWEYRKPAESRSGANTLANIGSFGVLSGAASYYADILKVELKANKVVGFNYQENVTTVTEPSLK